MPIYSVRTTGLNLCNPGVRGLPIKDHPALTRFALRTARTNSGKYGPQRGLFIRLTSLASRLHLSYSEDVFRFLSRRQPTDSLLRRNANGAKLSRGIGGRESVRSGEHY